MTAQALIPRVTTQIQDAFHVNFDRLTIFHEDSHRKIKNTQIKPCEEKKESESSEDLEAWMEEDRSVL